ILIVDASQGVEAQTLANVYLALENNLEILPVINKIDLPSARPDEAKKEIEDVIGLDSSYAPLVSAKEGIGIEDVLESVVQYFPAPSGDENAPLKALIFDSYYDNYKGVILFVRIKDGQIKVGDKIKTFRSDKIYDVVEVGVFSPNLMPKDGLFAGEVGYIAASIKSILDVAVGDTVINADTPAKEPLPGYKKVQSVVFCGIYPLDGSKFNDLKEAILKLQLNDASLLFEPDNSVALGFGFRCGFLGLLHMEIIQERIEREFGLEIITTAPSVSYKVVKTDGETIFVDNPSHLPPQSDIDHMEEPIVKADIYSPPDYLGQIMDLCREKRGTFLQMTYLDNNRVRLEYNLPLNEIIFDFFDSIKSRTRGYASFDYELIGYERSKLVKLDILLNGEACDALSMIVHEDSAYTRGRTLCENLKEAIPRQLFEVPVQAAIGGKIIARETVKAVRKDVLAKCYGGDITRKKKLLEKQKEGKKRMRSIGSVEVPSEVFMQILKTNKD
ncbi:MAG: translation elongation factor 4, partial [Clostridia bacterium]|nr:translation elongation factor 4 [Clostridia bacterium]